MDGIVWWIVVGLIAGWATGKLMKGSGYGALLDIIIGIVGAVVGGYLAGALGLAPAGGLIYTVVIAVLGACILVALFRLVSGRRAAV